MRTKRAKPEVKQEITHERIEKLNARATEEEQWSAHNNAADVTGDNCDTDAYWLCYIGTLELILDR